jgi:hypothetical protein
MVVPPLSAADVYAQVMALPLYLFMIFIWTFWTLLVYPLCALGSFYITRVVPRPHDRFDGPGFYLLIILTYPYAALLYGIAAFWWYMVMGWMIITSLPVALVRVLIGQGGVIANNFRLLWPFMKLNKFTYIGVARCVMGQIDRQGLGEFVWGAPVQGGIGAAVSLVPIIKYFWHINPFIYTLEEQFISQWTYPLDGTGLDEKRIIHGAKKMVSRAIQNKKERKIEDESKFCANYPWGPSMGKKADVVIGLQFPDASKTCNFTQTIHVIDKKCRSATYSHNGAPPTGKTGVYQVILNAFSFHFLTGYVEVNYRVDHGLEHPMWCIIPKHGMMGKMSYNWVNNLFSNFVPDVVAFEVEDYEEEQSKKEDEMYGQNNEGQGQ